MGEYETKPTHRNQQELQQLFLTRLGLTSKTGSREEELAHWRRGEAENERKRRELSAFRDKVLGAGVRRNEGGVDGKLRELSAFTREFGAARARPELNGEGRVHPTPLARVRAYDPPPRMVRERVSKADLDRLRAEREARAWRKANVGEIYPHNDLLWSPPVRPRRRGRVAKGDEKLLSRFELAIAAAVISKARVVRRDAVHKEAMRRARTDMAAEQQNRAHYFRQWTDHKNDHGHGWERKPTIGDSVKAVGKRSYDSWMDC